MYNLVYILTDLLEKTKPASAAKGKVPAKVNKAQGHTGSYNRPFLRMMSDKALQALSDAVKEERRKRKAGLVQEDGDTDNEQGEDSSS